ncbi:MAG: histidine phosphatase family protein [Thiomargarita sp.]|nr:histidine phosphatase family protein [Thiomargarita sp.]
MTQIFLVRHVETLWNIERKIQGHLDSPLTETGLVQAQALGKYFKSETFTAIYSSDLGRTYQTAQAIADKQNLPIIKKICLRERNFGIIQGTLKKELESKYPHIFPYYKMNEPNYVIPDGESLQQLHDRCVQCFEKLAQKHPNERILVVSHNGILVALVKYILGIELKVRPAILSSNASINVFSYQNDTWRIDKLGDLTHLNDV